MKRTASAHWNGTLKEGKGEITTQSKTLDNTQYSFNGRFAEGTGTNPEELIAAAHSGCFTMALSAALTDGGHTPGDLSTTATVTFDMAALQISGINLQLTAAAIDGLDETGFKQFAEGAKENCPISKVLAGAPISLEVTYG